MKRTIFTWLRRELKGWRKRNKNGILLTVIIALAFVAFLIGKLLGEGPPEGQWWLGDKSE